MDFKIRENRGEPQGRKALVRERAEYFQLMDQGFSSREACQIVGINRRTGKRWRNGRQATGNTRGAPPVRRPGLPEGPSRYLREADRIHIADRLREKASVRQIAAELGRSPSTISQEIRRNGIPLRAGSSRWAYRPHAAQARADARRPRPKPGKIGQNPELRDFIQHHLARRWSPEQICQALRARFPNRPEMHVTHETIYQALYVQGRGELRRDLTKALRTGRAMRRPHHQSYKRQPRMARDMVMISERPAEAADRAVPGHWEGDLIIGKAHKSAIGTLVERSSRFVTLVHLPDGRQPAQVRDALIQTASTLPAQLRRSLTWDQGSEMHLHKDFSLATNMPVYFCDPGSPWQRGSNENTNGLLRQYFPKGTDLARYSREELDTVAAELNNRPRKTLGWETPAERLAKLLATAS
ncbi:Integrase core domain protein [Streptomyces malaysiensis subsp. malaysiensis]|uniref:IS30 family transposase n=3 Tax=Streptomyces malaysiensis TaxID=92644 RepID=UPI000C2C4596|nr:IS30 family transposase [Streptomyces sp. M56]AUA10017.1 Integrase core domain protein [Streptomyces sp. M56]